MSLSPVVLFNRYLDRPEGYTEIYFTQTRFGLLHIAKLFMRFNQNRVIRATYTQQGHHYIDQIACLYLDLQDQLDLEASAI